MLMLCSNGLTSVPLTTCARNAANGGTAALIVTVDNMYKEKDRNVPRCVAELSELGLSVQTFDVDVQPLEDLLNFDAVEFIGGNPYYLLKSLKAHNAGGVLERIAAEKLLIGWSAGALVMGPTIGIIDRYSPEMNEWNITDLTGMCLTDVQILPHYSRFLSRYERFEERCREYEIDNACTVIRISDGEGVVIERDNVRIII